jgi:hypothetical protein
MSGANPSVPWLEPARPEVPKHTRAFCSLGRFRHARTVYIAHRLRTRCARSRTPSIDSIPTSRPKVTMRAEDILNRPDMAGTPRSRAVVVRPVTGSSDHHLTLLRGPPTVPLTEVRRPTCSPWRRCLSPISATDQLSRAPAGSLDSRASGLRLSYRALSAPPHRSPHRRAGDETEPSATAPDGP